MISIHGLNDLQTKLLAITDTMSAHKAMRRAARKAFQQVEQDAKANVAVFSGELRDSIRIAIQIPKSGDVVLVVGVKITDRTVRDEVTVDWGSGDSATYSIKRKTRGGWRWHFIEFGTVNQSAQPFLRPAMDRNYIQVVETFRAEMALAIERVIRTKQVEK